MRSHHMARWLLARMVFEGKLKWGEKIEGTPKLPFSSRTFVCTSSPNAGAQRPAAGTERQRGAEDWSAGATCSAPFTMIMLRRLVITA